MGNRKGKREKGIRLALLVLFSVFSFPVSAMARTYYIDCASGSDSNNGTSTSTPWKHQPYMSSTLNTLTTVFTGSYTHAAGDQFIFKGGVMCGSTALGIKGFVATSGGNSTTADYYGVSATYFAPVTGTVNTNASGTATWASGVHAWTDFTDCSVQTGVTFSGTSPPNCKEWLPVGGTITIGGSSCTVASYLAYNEISVSGCTLTTSSGVSFSFNYWTPPTFDGQGATDFMLRASASYITIDNIEFQGYYWACSAGDCAGYIAEGSYSNITITNNIFTQWTHAAYPTATDVFACIFGAGTGNAGVTEEYNIGFQTPDIATTDSGTFNYDGMGTDIEYNTLYNISSGFIGIGPPSGYMTIAYNTIHDSTVNEFMPSDHTDLIYTFGPAYIHDNLIYHVGNGGQVPVFPQCSTGNQYLYNNVIETASNTSVPIEFDQNNGTGDSSTAVCEAVNNTIVTGAGGGSCVRVANRNNGHGYGTIVIENNHCIQANGTGANDFNVDANLTITNFTARSNPNGTNGITITNYTSGPATLMSLTTANRDGYTSSRTYIYSPTSGTVPTVGAGANLTSACSTMIGLCSDTTYGAQGRSQAARPSSGPWDAGAYQFGVLMVHPAIPPSNLMLSAH